MEEQFNKIFNKIAEKYPYMNRMPIKRELFIEQKGLCAYCECDLYKEVLKERNLAIDHQIPKNNNGGNNIKNLYLTCQWCNSSKSTKSVKEFIKYLRPYIEGKVCKEELAQYHKYKELHKKFGKIK